ncbi:hypothetical protein EYF80_033201 [Liparis tanakae]|uniref:Uncharacterized protein n=1 Tax=Liparis tanakae TaxID=230148 RepID=A0A4Z2GSS1_9TELE|nr:hypothetical protein EYF80_033201 [Liparis tanakae]
MHWESCDMIHGTTEIHSRRTRRIRSSYTTQAVGGEIIGQWKQRGEAASVPNQTLRHNSINPPCALSEALVVSSTPPLLSNDCSQHNLSNTASAETEHSLLGGQRERETMALRLSRKRGQKSLKSGRSIFFRLSLVLASTLTYNWVTGTRVLGMRENMEPT